MNEMNEVPLTKLQKEIMAEFYSIPATKVIFDKIQRNELWHKAIKKDNSLDLSYIQLICPALEHQIKKSYETGKNIQSAVFSECVYAQTFANMFKLYKFVNCFENENFIPYKVKLLLKSYNLFPRYAYSTDDKRRMLIQAGGCNGIDSALISVVDLNIYTIEFKEPSAKTTEADLPKYGENGSLIITEKFKEKYPQFIKMLEEHKNLNFFEVMGRNINNFSNDSINIAVTNNYAKKYADVVCTEDINGYLVMLPINQMTSWSDIQGEIRPAGRNHYNAWTPNKLKMILKQYNAEFNGNIVKLKKMLLEQRLERGSDHKLSGYKISPLFFIYIKDCNNLNNSDITFDINKVQQLNPTITAKIFFKKLKYEDVKEYYDKDF